MSPGLASVLLLLCLFAHEAKSASVSLAQDPEGPQLIPIALSRSTEDFEFYQHEDHLCRKCPAGFHVEKHCVTSNTSGKCTRCEEGAEFTEYPNALSKCLTCRVCRKDEVQLSRCNSSKNTQCTCMNGTFCSPDHPCEICQRCRLRCPDGDVQVSSCTPQSDIQCVHPTDPPPVAGGIAGWTAVWIAAPVILILLAVFLWWCWYSRNSSPGGDSRKMSASFKFPVTKARILSPLRNCTRGRLATQDNRRNEQLDQESQHGLLAVSDPKEAVRKNSRCETTALSPADSAPKQEGNPASQMASRRKKLVPGRGKDPIETLRCSFDTFTQEVPFKDWRRFGRALLLTENEIEIAERTDKYSQEPHYQMLCTWLNKAGVGASVNQLLETLDKIDLRGVADIICSKLLDLYEEEELN
ncbi:Tumor necrosis factor receptor superfamily member 10B [Platysternon megacephalum]|uniref:Tumor necrosis factor receptor superfamily member 10B n=1 Tax=Platysternon megacephalum TaxID=55544 RepID=A0A4D9ED09_9SAUR|nr:Tumor necrosis factor receptor superfamily member 10B [Platysternon megacephalum]